MTSYEDLVTLLERTQRANAETRELIDRAGLLLAHRQSLRMEVIAHVRDIARLGRTVVDELNGSRE
ncbi:MAG: hypothetical protein ABI837_00180 [Acidobacteriota bacterium]